MEQHLSENHKTDPNGLPAGGITTGIGMEIHWQDGPLVVDGHRRQQTGAFVEDTIRAAMGRLKFYQSTELADEQIDNAFVDLTNALNCLGKRGDRWKNYVMAGSSSGKPDDVSGTKT